MQIYALSMNVNSMFLDKMICEIILKLQNISKNFLAKLISNPVQSELSDVTKVPQENFM